MILREELMKRRRELEDGLSVARVVLRNETKGRLEVMKRDGFYRYYYISNKDEIEKKIYIDKENMKLAKELANRDYCRKAEKAMLEEMKRIDRLLELYTMENVEACYENLHPGRKRLVTPVLETDEAYISNWIQCCSGIANPIKNSLEILTDNQERVRSKSEKIIADRLFALGIPYKYEEALMLGGKVVFPDFTVLNTRTRKTFYWEHFGMIDDPEYLEKALKKVELYGKNDIIVGENLLITYETRNQPLLSSNVEVIIQNHLKKA